MNDKKIYLREKHNYGLIVALIFVLIALLLGLTSKLWLPDDRENKSYNLDRKLIFSYADLERQSDFVWDPDTNIGEVSYKIYYYNDDPKYTVNFNMKSDSFEIPFKVIRGDRKPTIDTSYTYEQDVILQFTVPKEFYYFEILGVQEEIKQEKITVDYRSFVNGELLEKGENYLVEIEKRELEKSKLQDEKKQAEEQLQAKEKNLADVQNKLKGKLSDKDKQNLQGQEKNLKLEIDKFKKQIETLDIRLQNYVE